MVEEVVDCCWAFGVSTKGASAAGDISPSWLEKYLDISDWRFDNVSGLNSSSLSRCFCFHSCSSLSSFTHSSCLSSLTEQVDPLECLLECTLNSNVFVPETGSLHSISSCS